MTELQREHSFATVQQTLQLRCKNARGGISSLALTLGKCEKKLANELNVNVDQNKLGFMDAVQLIVLTKSRNVLEMMAREVGCTLLPMPACKQNPVDQLREVLNLSSQAGQLCGKYSRSISPNSELGENLSQMCGRVFFKSISTENVDNTLQQDFLPDVDMAGNNLDVFSARWFYSALAYGVSYVLVDYTRTENVKTVADEKAVGARPYFVHIKPQSVLGFKTKTINGKQQLTQFRYKETIVEDDGEFGEKTVEQICVYDIGRVRRYRKLQSGWERVEDFPLFAQNQPLDYIPIVAFATNQTGFMLGDPNASMDTVIKLQASGNLSKQSTFEEAKRRGLISDNLEWEEEQARLEAEGLGYESQFNPETDT